MEIRPRALVLLASVSTALAAAPIAGSHVAAGEPSVVVEAGDTLSQIALEQGVSVEQIVQLNALPDPNRIFVGQHLQLVPAASAEAAAPQPVGAATHVVQSGENLTWIAARYGTSVSAIASANGIENPSRVFAGQTLSIPGQSAPASAASPAAPPAAATALPAAPPAAAAAAPPAAPSSPAGSAEHHVAPGENLTWIAARYGTTIGEIVAANGLVNPSFIRAGDVLRIPVAAGPPSAPTVAPAAPPDPAAVAGGMPPSMAELVAARDDVRRVIVEEAAAFGVPPAFALAVAWQESGWQQGVVSHAGAVGVMQLLPATGEWVGQAMLGTPVDIHDTRANVRAGVRLLAHYLARYNGDRALVLAAYYQGQTAADRHGIYPVSRPYIASIIALEALFGG